MRRRDEAWMDALGAKIIPDPTTAGDFLRGFSEKAILTLMGLINDCSPKKMPYSSKEYGLGSGTSRLHPFAGITRIRFKG